MVLQLQPICQFCRSKCDQGVDPGYGQEGPAGLRFKEAFTFRAVQEPRLQENTSFKMVHLSAYFHTPHSLTGGYLYCVTLSCAQGFLPALSSEMTPSGVGGPDEMLKPGMVAYTTRASATVLSLHSVSFLAPCGILIQPSTIFALTQVFLFLGKAE